LLWDLPRCWFKDVMITDLVTVRPNVSVKDAVAVMNDFEIGCLIVVDNGSVIGILTERDVLKRLWLRAESLRKPLSGMSCLSHP